MAAPALRVYNKDFQIKTPNLDKLAEKPTVFDPSK